MRMCMFCCEKASTKEDVWPLWLMKRFSGSGTARMDAERSGRPLGNWPAAKRTLLVKRLCGSCNHGWMSRLENEAKPVIEAILDDMLEELDIAVQSTLARWAVKTAMVLEAVDPGRHWFYSVGERQRMRTEHALPQRTSVWIAKCIDQLNVYSAAEELWTATSQFRAFAATMAFGSLALQVVTIRTPAEISPDIPVTYDVSEGPWDQILVRVWPSSQDAQVWPPSHGLAGSLGLDTLTKRLSPQAR